MFFLPWPLPGELFALLSTHTHGIDSQVPGRHERNRDFLSRRTRDENLAFPIESSIVSRNYRDLAHV